MSSEEKTTALFGKRTLWVRARRVEELWKETGVVLKTCWVESIQTS